MLKIRIFNKTILRVTFNFVPNFMYFKTSKRVKSIYICKNTFLYYRNALITTFGVNSVHDLTLNIYMAIISNKACKRDYK